MSQETVSARGMSDTARRSGARARPWPREHGAWAILLVSFAAGWAVAWRADPRLIPLLVACVFALAVRTHVLEVASRQSLILLWPWGVVDGLVSLAGLCATAVGRPAVVGMAALGLFAMSADAGGRAMRLARGLAADVASIGALTLAGPAALYVASGTLSGDAFWLWAALTMHFLGAVLRVRARLAQTKDITSGARTWRAMLVYHAAAALIAGALGAFGSAPRLLWTAFAPAVLWAFREPRHAEPVVLATIGRRERNGSLLFAVLAALAFRLR
ncbi:MAG: YwiC-like family protein [Armatimonadota bacterium]